MVDMDSDVCDPLLVYHKYRMVLAVDDAVLHTEAEAGVHDNSRVYDRNNHVHKVRASNDHEYKDLQSKCVYRTKASKVQIRSMMALDEDRVVYGNNGRGNALDVNQILYNQATNGTRGNPVQIYHNCTDWLDAYDSLGSLHCLCCYE